MRCAHAVEVTASPRLGLNFDGGSEPALQVTLANGPTPGRLLLRVDAPENRRHERQRLIDVLHIEAQRELERLSELAVFGDLDGACIDLPYDACACSMVGFLTSPFANEYRTRDPERPILRIDPGPLTRHHLDTLWPQVAARRWRERLLQRLSPLVALQPTHDGAPLHLRLIGEAGGTCLVGPEFLPGSDDYLRSLGIVAALAKRLEVAGAITEEQRRVLCVGAVPGLSPAIRVPTDRLRAAWAFFMHWEVLAAFEARQFSIEASGVELPASLTGDPPNRPSIVPNVDDLSGWGALP